MDRRETCLVFALVCLSPALCFMNLKINDCGGPDALIKLLDNPIVSPYPVTIPGNVTITGKGELTRALNGHYNVDVTIQRYVGFLWLTVPCLLGTGSCTFDVCPKLDEIKEWMGGCAPGLIQSGVPCTCQDIKAPAVYTLNHQEFQLPDLSGLYSWLAAGDYKAELRLREQATLKEVGCLKLEGTLQEPPCNGFLCSIIG